ncbi:TetR/AcrR family transcriptional regulator [Herbidospora galbida]|uniref:TetR/AcrR family transcriptional regulator n=1 Tax=Herbidospora galbida TaxID=2575442 RepID=A0A4U3LSP4_9ACTN|nr:TetR/AcrR family transcriptional regulator [Herbidospora galbida]TKK79018.1 TetR/AcrR family transcriptional regulator [Herbidospora galbida]
MGHREDLLAGAKKCLYERGYAQTTARDIVAASGTNLASIGYHFGSKEALLNAALMEVLTDLGRSLDAAVAGGDRGDHAGGLGETWRLVRESFAEHQPIWVAGIGAYVQSQYSPDLRDLLAPIVRGILGQLAEEVPGADEKSAKAIASIQLALLTGLVLQWVVDPDHALTGPELAEGLRALTGPTG